LSIVDNPSGRRSNPRIVPTLPKTLGAAPPVAAPHPTIALLQTSSLASVAQGELERLILSGELAPGAKLTEMALAARLGISRGPLREAFRMLEEAGLVRTEKNRGVFVRDIPIDEALEIFDLRAAMEELVGRRLAESISAAQLKEIRALVDAMERLVKAEDARGYHLLNLQFHERLVDMAGNRKLVAIYRKLIKELSLFRRLNLADGWLLPISAGEHRAIVKAIASGDVQAAGRAMFEHVMDSKQRTVAHHERRHRQQPGDVAHERIPAGRQRTKLHAA
jgi:phosphonate utilization transcriptional regulator